MGTDKRARQKELHRTRAEAARKAAEAQARRRRMVNGAITLAAVGAIIGGILFWTSDSDDTTTAADSAKTSTTESVDSVGSTSSTPDGSSAEGTTSTAAPAAVGTADCPAADGSAEKKSSFDGPPKMCISGSKTYAAKIETTKGDFTITFDDEKAPNTVNNFVFLARYHYFDGIIFHRIIKDFMIQGGDPEGTGTGGPGYEFADELPQPGEYKKYSVAMANAGPDTNGSQFFIITGDQGVALPPSYSLFGQVTDGMDVIDKLGVVKTGDSDRPVDEIAMEKVTVSES